MKPLQIAMLGAGNRGRDAYGSYALQHPHEIDVVAVAETGPERRQLFADEHNIPRVRCFESAEQLLQQPRMCDAVFICTGDRDHFATAMGAIENGYHVFLEKPMAVDPAQCLAIAEAAEAAGVTLVIAHVLRYAPLFQHIHRLLERGAIGRLVTMQHNENVGYYHFAHSYVRGNWRREDQSSPILLAKSCHDMDLLYWFAGAPCEAVSSFGSLIHFKAQNAPPGHTERCLDGCPHFHTCPFSVERVYLSREYRWPATVITPDPSPEARIRALRSGMYGRCVYACDNDVADNQVVSLQFSNGVTASFTLCGFTHDISRTLKLMGTEGEIRAHLERNEIELHSFREDSVHAIVPGNSTGAHGGGDWGIMRSFVTALRCGDGSRVVSARESAEGHLIALAADEARQLGEVVSMPQFLKQFGAAT